MNDITINSHIGGPVQDCSNFIPKAPELLQPCNKQSIYGYAEAPILEFVTLKTCTRLHQAINFS